jgi:rhodanese-related sulfurtransferase
MNQVPATVPQVDVTEADRRRRDENAALVDVREAHEFEAIRADGAVLVPLSTFATRFEELPRDRPVLLICQSGNRSMAAAAHLLRSGWTDVANVAGGTLAWERAGLPVQSGPAEG